jgi:Cof subfamily protein (haloacid dehalogenase superfamily)
MAQTGKKDFSDWLVVSDIDGTLNTKLRTLPARNLKAIRHFVLDLGGHFTLASGRNVASLEKHFNRLPISNTPAIVLNGAGIYDFAKGEMISFSPINEEGRKIVKEIHKRFPKLEIEICTPDNILLINSFLYGPILVKADNLPHKKCKSIDDALPYDWGKVVFFGLPYLINEVKKFTKILGGSAVNYMSSSIVTYEMLAKDTHKGTAVKKLAGMLNIDYEHTAAIGDYFNDYDMLLSVFLPAACGQAPKEIHQISKFHACHCNKGAVADFLEYIEKAYNKI